jgi:hypothetical protein
MNRYILLLSFCIVFSHLVIAQNKVNRITLNENQAMALGFKVSNKPSLKQLGLDRSILKLEFPHQLEQAQWIQVNVAMYQNNKYLSSVSQTAPNSENRIFYQYNPRLIDKIKLSVYYSDSRIYQINYDVPGSNIIEAGEVDKPPQLWSWFKDLQKPKADCLKQSFLALSEIGIPNIKQNEYGFYGTFNNNSVVVKCLTIDSNHSKAMVAVAGKNRKSVEPLRNNIIKLIQ